MNNTIFSFQRFKTLFVRDFFANLRPMISTIGGVFIVLSVGLWFLLVMIPDWQITSMLQDFSNTVYYIAFGIAGIAVSGTAFRDFRRKEKSMHYLMLPSTTLEKFLSQYVLVTLVFGLLLSFLYYVFSAINVASIALFTDYSLAFIHPFENLKPIYFFRYFIPTQLFFLAGAVTFKKVPIFFTALFGFLFLQVQTLSMWAIAHWAWEPFLSQGIVLPDSTIMNNTEEELFLQNLSVDTLPLLSIKVFYIFYQYILPLLLSLYIGYKIKERQS